MTDEAGLKVIDAINAITMQVEGACQLIGIDNGELDYIGPYKTNTRNAYQGSLLVTVKRTSPTGKIQLTAVAPELTTAVLQVK